MPEFAVSESKQRDLAARMAALGLTEEDLEEQFVRSSGKGGQHVNKTSTCVRIRHRPSGIEIKCMVDRSQSVNRFLARRALVEQLEGLAGKATPRDREEDKLRRRKARRKRKGAAKYHGNSTAGETGEDQQPIRMPDDVGEEQ
jgi:protein subunit release factor B